MRDRETVISSRSTIKIQVVISHLREKEITGKGKDLQDKELRSQTLLQVKMKEASTGRAGKVETLRFLRMKLEIAEAAKVRLSMIKEMIQVALLHRVDKGLWREMAQKALQRLLQLPNHST